MIAEALLIADEAQGCERVADERAHRWLANAELSAGLLRKAVRRAPILRRQRGRWQRGC